MSRHNLFFFRDFYLSLGWYFVIFSPRFVCQRFLQDSCSCVSSYVLTGRYSYLYRPICFCRPCSVDDHLLLDRFLVVGVLSPTAASCFWRAHGGIWWTAAVATIREFYPLALLATRASAPPRIQGSRGHFFISPSCACVDFLFESEFGCSLCSVYF